MADPRFYDNRGPFSLAEISRAASVSLPEGVNPTSEIADLATLDGAGPEHLSLCMAKKPADVLAASRAGYCLVELPAEGGGAPAGPRLLFCTSVRHA
ncbi:MAG TPA: hypothetical protein VIY09_02045, partial [Rhizomicrobium sp.]